MSHSFNNLIQSGNTQVLTEDYKAIMFESAPQEDKAIEYSITSKT